jgi:flagellar export protein FliJ
MPRFRFALEGLLTSRRAAERLHQRAVAEIERERMGLEDRLRAQQASIAGGRQEVREALVGRIDARVLRLHAANSIQQLRLGQRLALELAGVHRRLEAARQALVEAAQSRRAIELLRERRLEEWNAGIAKAETEAIDELAIIAAARNRTGA